MTRILCLMLTLVTLATGSQSQIDQLRKSDIVLLVTTERGIKKEDVQIQVVQTKKSFPFGTAVNVEKYNENAAGGKYREMIHKYFNWVVPENALKWQNIEPRQGEKDYEPALNMINGVRSHGIKVRGHNLVWSVPDMVPSWVRELCDDHDQLKTVVQEHIEETMEQTRGLLEHWDVNNHNLHGTWYQDCLGEPNYNLELFNISHQADSAVKLFLNDYVENESDLTKYLNQTKTFKEANIGLSGIGLVFHYGNDAAPEPEIIKQRLDTLAQAGVPIWITELAVQTQNEHNRALFYEKALRTFYGHPAVEGILLWGFWDQAHYRGLKSSLVSGKKLRMTAAGRRVFNLLEKEWMTDETKSLPRSGNKMTFRGFHGDYEVKVMYQGRELTDLKTEFTLGQESQKINIRVRE